MVRKLCIADLIGQQCVVVWQCHRRKCVNTQVFASESMPNEKKSSSMVIHPLINFLKVNTNYYEEYNHYEQSWATTKQE